MMFQLSLQFRNTREALQHSFEKAIGKSLSLHITDNSTSMLSIKSKGNTLFLRMHWMFLNAGDEVIREIIDFVKTRKRRTPAVSAFISENRACLREQSQRQVSIRTQGRFYDLREIFDDLNSEYFRGRISTSISWGKQTTRRHARKRLLGSYWSQTNAIRINPVLDRKSVPLYVIRYIVYHEMLHSVVKEERRNGRRRVHTPAFRKQEQSFKDYNKAVAWEKRNR